MPRSQFLRRFESLFYKLLYGNRLCLTCSTGVLGPDFPSPLTHRQGGLTVFGKLNSGGPRAREPEGRHLELTARKRRLLPGLRAGQ